MLTRRGTVVIVDDDETMRSYPGETPACGGYTRQSFRHGGKAPGWLASEEILADLLLSDINMPGMSGLDLLRTVKAVIPNLPFILIPGLCDLPTAHGALPGGPSDYLFKPVRPANLPGLLTRHMHAGDSARFEAVKEALAKRTGRLSPIFDALGFKRFETLQHSRRVAGFALLIARDLNLSPEALRALETGALLHDIGKAGIPHNVLMKPGKLSGEEWAMMKMHPQLGLDLLSGQTCFAKEAEVVYSHHESFDGKGYPRQLAGEEIPLSARVFAVADTLDALTSDRCYRPGQSLPAARAEIHHLGGTQLDPAILKLFQRVEDREFEMVRRQFPDLP